MRDRLAHALRVLLVAAALVGYGLALRYQPAAGQDVEPGRRALAVAVAKVGANEASLTRIRPAEVALIWQVTEHRASTTAGRLRWLRAHSSCVLTDRPMGDAEAAGNCRWSRHLDGSDARPEGFPAHLRWDRYADRWAQVRELAWRLVTGRVVMRPCPEPPFTWGGPMDRERALAHGLRPLGCTDAEGRPTLNEGYAIDRAGGAS